MSFSFFRASLRSARSTPQSNLAKAIRESLLALDTKAAAKERWILS
ncbi:hypothetical protein DsansV1_C01g0009141 [Dioscorea sansibarensis]